MGRKVLLVATLIALMCPLTSATIRNIPSQYATIQAGINASINGDTVLVAEGRYYERINFLGKAVMVLSFYEYTNDTISIHNTIIDADTIVISNSDTASVVRFTNSEDSLSVLQGFTIINGTGSILGGHAKAGGGIFCHNSSPKIINNIILNNSCSYGGGICCDSSSAIIKDNYIISNSANAGGGGVFCQHISRSLLENNIICDNKAHGSGIAGGGILVSNGAAPFINRNIIMRNDVVYHRNGENGSGGGIGSSYSSPKIEFNIIKENRATKYGAGIALAQGSPDTIKSNLIINNYADSSYAAIYCGANNIVIVSNTISNNLSANCGGIFYQNGSIKNTIIWNNSFPQVSGNGVATFCDIQGGLTGQGNINSNPYFIDPSNDNYGLCVNSSCIDAGDRSIKDIDGSRSDIGIFQCEAPIFETPYSNIRIRCTYPNCPEFGEVIHVSINGNDSSGDGSNYSPFKTIQFAINTAHDQDTILVHPGLYRENVRIDRKGITLCSNFIYSADSNDISNTVIVGDSILPAITFENYNIDSTGAIIGFNIQYGLGAGVYCDHAMLIIKNNQIFNNLGSGVKGKYSRLSIVGNNIANNAGDSSGGGVECYYSTVIIKKNMIKNNATNLRGGGINTNESMVSIDSCIIIENSSGGNGGGVYTYHSTVNLRQNELRSNHASFNGGALGSWGGRGTYNSNTFDSNSTNGSGGGLFIETCDCNFDSNIVTRNMAGISGGAFYFNISPAIVKWNDILFNSADSVGGGIYFGNRPPESYFYHLISNNNISYNQAGNYGGGIYSINSGLDTRNNNISQNWAGVAGGAAYYDQMYPQTGISNNNFAHNSSDSLGGGIVIRYCWPKIYGNIILHNISIIGAGMICKNANPTLLNCLFTENIASSKGGALFCILSTPVIRNTIFWADSALSSPEIYADSLSRPVFSYCDIEGGFEGTGNLDNNPLFRNIETGDFHLMSQACSDSATSPLIDMGSPTDLDSLLSCQDGLGTNRSDIGAFGGGRWVPVGVEEEPEIIPQEFCLSQNYPNPFNPTTTISYNLPKASYVSLDVYDILGRKIIGLVSEKQQSGAHQIVWDALDNASGIYFYRLKADEHSETKKMLLLR